MKKQKENPARCAGECKQSEVKIGEKKRMVDPAKFEFCDEITRRMCEENGEGGRCGG